MTATADSPVFPTKHCNLRIENAAYQTVSRNRKEQLTATSFASCLPSNWSIIGRSRPFEPFLDHLKHVLKGRLHARIYLELQATSFKSKWMFVETTIFQVQMFWLLSPGAYDPPTKVCVVFSLLFMWFFCAPENLTFKTCGMNFMCHDVYGKMPFPENMLFTVKLGKLFYNPVFDFWVLSPLQHPKVGCAASTVPQKCFPPGRKNDSVTLFLHLVNLIANPVFHRGGGKLLQKSPVEQTTPTTSSLDQTMWLVFKMIHVYKRFARLPNGAIRLVECSSYVIYCTEI